ncbi:MAG: hypothetical protein INQ03_12355 [Candidatus Heimdallarchaeota archaeon]|nr:hypothetical protein [Candidatus Heimdallarchaeota archaeon]
MSLEKRLTEELEDFEEKTSGILGSCVISTSSALMMAEASAEYDRGVIQAMSEKLITLSKETLNMLFDDASLKSVTIEEEDHYLYVRRINKDYHVVVLTDTTETMGLREVNIRELIKRIQVIFG